LQAATYLNDANLVVANQAVMSVAAVVAAVSNSTNSSTSVGDLNSVLNVGSIIQAQADPATAARLSSYRAVRGTTGGAGCQCST
jgi:hypothetical protein